MTGHDVFDEALSAYALDALDAAERQTFEAHLETCAVCRGALADLRRVTTALALSVDPVPPTADLKTRTLARATGGARLGPAPAANSRSARWGWLAAVAAVILLLGLASYTWTLRRQVEELDALVDQAERQIRSLRAELVDVRRDSATLLRTVNVLGATDVVKVELRGQAGALGAAGAAYWSASTGLVVSVIGMPALAPNRVYQLWIVPTGGAQPISAGFLSRQDTGVATFASPASVPARPAALAVTVEPAGGSPGPTTPIVLIGQL